MGTVFVITNHSAVKSILDKPGKYVQWWLKIFGSVVGQLRIIHSTGHENVGADALSCTPVADSMNPEESIK